MIWLLPNFTLLILGGLIHRELAKVWGITDEPLSPWVEVPMALFLAFAMVADAMKQQVESET